MTTTTPTRNELPSWLTAGGIDGEPFLRAALNRRSELLARKGAISGELRASELASSMADEQAAEGEVAALAGTSTRAAANAAAQHAAEVRATPDALRREAEQLERASALVDLAIDKARVSARKIALDAARPLILERFNHLCAAVKAASDIDLEIRELRAKLGDSAAGLPGPFRELFVAPDFSPLGQHPTLFGGTFAEKLLVWKQVLADGTE